MKYNPILIFFFSGCMLAAVPNSPIWYLTLSLLFLYDILWFFSRNRANLVLPLFCTGLVSSLAVWYASPWYAYLVLVIITSMLLEQMGRLEWRTLLVMAGLLAIITTGVAEVNHPLLPVLILAGISLLFLLYVVLSEFKLRKAYR